MASKWSHNHSKNTLLHNMRDLDFFCYLQHFVATEPPKKTQNVLQSRMKKSTASNLKKSPHKLQNGAHKGDFEMDVAPLGAPLAPQSVF